MKHKIILVSTLLSLPTITSFYGCGSSTSEPESTDWSDITSDEELDRQNKEYLKDLEDYKAQTIISLEENEKAIAELRLKMKKNDEKPDSPMEREIERLEERNNKLKSKMENYQEEGKANWEKFKSEFKHDMKELGNAFKSVIVNDVK